VFSIGHCFTSNANSSFGDSVPPIFMIKHKTFEEKALDDQQLDRDHDFVIRNPNTAFVSESLPMDWLQTQFIPKNNQLRRKTNSEGAIIVIDGGHAAHVSPRVLASAGSQRRIIIQLVAYSSRSTNRLIYVYLASLTCLINAKQKGRE
jgi:hypothetical protein